MKKFVVMLTLAIIMLFINNTANAFSLFGSGGHSKNKNNHHNFQAPIERTQFNPAPYMLPEKNPHIEEGSTPGTFVIDNPGNYSGIFTDVNGKRPNPVPEPASLVLFATGVVMMAVRGRKRFIH